MDVHDAKILGAIAVGGNAVVAVGSDLKLGSNDVELVKQETSGDLPEQTLSFLSNLNQD